MLVNNAAYQMAQKGGLRDSTEQLERTFETNVFAMFWLCKAALPHMRPGSTVINTSSIEAYNPKPPLLDYAATKGAIVNFSKGFAVDGAKYGGRGNTLAPGPIWTPRVFASDDSSYVTGEVLGVTGGGLLA